ncbi:MAG: O-methyltransferase [Methyloligella sp. ZOD6]
MKKPLYYRKYDYDKGLLPNAHLRSLEEGVTNIEEAQERTRWSIGYPGWGLIYHLLLCHLKPDGEETIIETGTNEGCTTIILAQALKDSGANGRVYSIELDSGFVAKARENVIKAGLADRVELLEGDSRKLIPQIAPEIVGQSGKIRSVVLDASHLYDDVMQEFETILPFLSDDALVIFDNTYPLREPHEDQRVNGALKTIKSKFGGNLLNLEYVSWYTPGLAIWQKSPNL